MHSIKNWLKAAALGIALICVVPVVGSGLPSIGAAVASAQVVSSISVTGNTRVEAETVRSYVTVRPGQNFSAADIDESIKALFATGLFSDVKITRSGGTLVVAVVENPVITRIAFEGNDRHDDAALGSLIELQPRSVLTQAKVQSDTQRILELYRRTGRYNATVEPQVIDLGQNRVDLVFKIDEGPRTEVNRISFVGNKAYSDGRLQDVIATKESGFLGWLKSSDNYDPDRLNADQEALRRFYYNHGYADFRIVSAVADFDREQNGFFITFTVEEGEQYTYGDINVETTLAEVNPEDLKALADTSPGAVYSAREVEKSLEQMTVAVAERGYAFAQVRPRGDRDYANHKISITYFIDEGPRAYIERINITGNTRTRDYVIRREFDVAEGDAYNQVMIDKAERRLNALGFFKSVKIWTEPGSAPDRVVVNVQVEDQSTGEISVGAGYSTTDGVIIELSVTEKNLLGRGQFVRASIGQGENGQTYELSFTEPYFLEQRLAAGFDIYKREYDQGDGTIHPYDETLTGGTIRFGIPIDDEVSVGLRWNLYNRDITDINDDLNNDGYVDTVNIVQPGETFYSVIGYTVTYDTIDNKLFPREGVFAAFSQDFAGVGGDVSWLKTAFKADYYQELLTDYDVVGHVRLIGGYVFGVGEDISFLDQFRPGPENIRGFASEGFGPRDEETGYMLGGQLFVGATAETIFPLPMVPKEFGFSGSLFTDAGSVWDTDMETANAAGAVVESNDFNIRASVGVGLLWQSPFGLLRADVAYPFLKEEEDQTEYFRFSGGTKF